MTSQIAKDLEECTTQVRKLRDEIKRIRDQQNGNILASVSANVQVTDYEPKTRNPMTGHFGKIYALHWGADSNSIVTASQDGKLIIWASHTGNKQLAITLNSAWVMTCAFSPTYEYIASGGLDNTVSIFKVGHEPGPNDGRFRSKEIYRELEKHDGYLSCVRFVSDEEVISSSGDGTCILWNVEKQAAVTIFMDHTGDVMSVDLNPHNPKLFCSGSVDQSAKIWDMQASDRHVMNFPGKLRDQHDVGGYHTADINAVKWFTDPECLITGSDDGTVRLFDRRSCGQLNCYEAPDNRSLHSAEASGVTSVDVSLSGSYIFSAYDNGQVYMWSSLRATKVHDMPHESRVSALGVSPDGYALATGCWDFNLRVFA